MLLLPRELPSCVGRKKKRRKYRQGAVLRCSGIALHKHVRFLMFPLKVKLEMSAWQMHVCQDVFTHSSETQISQWGAAVGARGAAFASVSGW